MSREFVQNKYNHGDVVFAKVNPIRALVIRRYVDQVYYCQIQNDTKSKELVYYERELVGNPELEAKNEKSREKEVATTNRMQT
ncbi:MAG: hypothetical protein RLN88_00200 [Ekhidna sp.]|uniref:hypothetical protein n=1 Tax=Ekhidna sp. TaxID=2608089 RepID=UPI0032ED7E70